MRREGFTLIELSITMGILAVVTLLMFMVVMSSTASVSASDANSVVQSNIRDVMVAMTRELQLAAKNGNAALTPVLTGIQIVNNPVAGSPVEIVFQTPQDSSGQVWSSPIRYRYVDEDTDEDGRLGPEEDINGNGLLDRRILRIQDRNGDGDTADANEELIVGGANNIGRIPTTANPNPTDVQFVLAGDVLEITLTATKFLGARRTNPATATATSRVYLMN